MFGSDVIQSKFCKNWRFNHRSDGTMKKFITSQIYDKIAFSLYSSLLSIRYFELGELPSSKYCIERREE